MNKDYETLKAELWIQAWCSCASAGNCVKTSTCNAWADSAVREFETRFKATLTKENP